MVATRIVRSGRTGTRRWVLLVVEPSRPRGRIHQHATRSTHRTSHPDRPVRIRPTTPARADHDLDDRSVPHRVRVRFDRQRCRCHGARQPTVRRCLRPDGQGEPDRLVPRHVAGHARAHGRRFRDRRHARAEQRGTLRTPRTDPVATRRPFPLDRLASRRCHPGNHRTHGGLGTRRRRGLCTGRG